MAELIVTHALDRVRGSETPRYLLFDYPEMLVAQGDVPRLVALCTDRARHAWMFENTGADIHAMTQIDTTVDLLAAAETPDINDLLQVALARKQLSQQNSGVPAVLPAAWAVLGDLDRAVAVARSISDIESRASALLRVVAAVAAPPDVLKLAETTAYAMSPGMSRAKALCELATITAAAGDVGACLVHIEATLEATRDFDLFHEHDTILAELAKAAQRIGDPDRAVGLALACSKVDRRVEALNKIAIAAALAGDRARVPELARKAATLIEESAAEDWAGLPWSLEKVVGALTAIGRGDPAVERVLAQVDRPYRYSRVMEVWSYAEAAAELAPAGDNELLHAAVDAAFAASLDQENTRADVFGILAVAASLSGDAQTYEVTIREAQSAALLVSYPPPRVRLLTLLIKAAARIGDHDRYRALADDAQATAPSIEPAWNQAKTTAELAKVVADAGDPDRARKLISLALTATRGRASGGSIMYRDELVRALAVIGDDVRAERVARLASSDGYQARLLGKLAGWMADSGDRTRAVELARDAETTYLIDPDNFWPLCAITKAVAAIGDDDWYWDLFGQAEELAGEEDLNLYQTAQQLAGLAAVAAHRGDRGKAVELAERAEEAADADEKRCFNSEVLGSAVEALAVAGDFDGAEELARRIDPDGEDFPVIVSALISAGQLDRAEQLARDITDSYWAPETLAAVAVATSELSRAIELAATAESAARALDRPDLRDLTLGGLASALSADRRFDEITRRLVVEVLTTPSWSQALVAVARLAPEAIRTMADEVLSGRD